jgi:glycosidase
MRKSMSLAAAAALLVLAGSAHADEISGEIHNIDLTRNTFAVGDDVFQWSSMNSLGPKLEDLMEGQPVTVVYDPNQDGTNDNYSWNCGWEGPTDDPGINALRQRQMKNAASLLMVSQGVPMILMGDEVARTQHGNNNTYCHDNELNWFNWRDVERNADQLRFFQQIIAFRNLLIH